VQRLSLPGVRSAVWVKRDDLDAPAFGGNKVRALEFLLGDVRPGDVVLTLGGEGSTHVLATAVLARRLGAVPRAVHWRHEMNPIAHAAAARAHTLCEIVARSGNAMTGIARAYLARRRGGVRWVPLGGTSPLGMLGHVNAGLELAAQIARGEHRAPSR
jgi:D-cysteine desulfhydrase